MAEVARRTGLHRSKVAGIVDSVLDVVKDQVSKGHRVTLMGFGTFERRRRNARVGRNVRTGETVKVAPRNVPAFRPGIPFRDTVSSGGKRKKAAARKRPVKKTVRKR